MELEEQSTIAADLMAGKPDAWNALYDAHCQRIWNFVARMIGSRSQDVADVVQETFLAAARSVGSYDASRGTPTQWIFGIARNQIAVYLRGHERQRRFIHAVEALSPVSGQLGRWLDGCEELDLKQLEDSESSSIIRRTLLLLPEDYAELLSVRYLEEKRVDEVAQMYGVTAVALRSKLARARQAFREQFKRLTVTYANG